MSVGLTKINMDDTLNVVFLKGTEAPIAVVYKLLGYCDGTGTKLGSNAADCIHRHDTRCACKTQRINITAVIHFMRRHDMPIAMPRNKE